MFLLIKALSDSVEKYLFNNDGLLRNIPHNPTGVKKSITKIFQAFNSHEDITFHP